MGEEAIKGEKKRLIRECVDVRCVGSVVVELVKEKLRIKDMGQGCKEWGKYRSGRYRATKTRKAY